MANNKVQLADGTVLMDVTDTTALASTVKSGDIFYNAAGIRQTGTLIVDETYSIQQNLTNVTSSVDDIKVIAGNCFYSKLTPLEGYKILSVIVTMNGVDITREVFKPGAVEKTITQNGIYNASLDGVSGYSQVIVNVSNSYTSSDEGKVVSGGALIPQTSALYTSNGTYDTTEINSVTVNVAGGAGTSSVFKMEDYIVPSVKWTAQNAFENTLKTGGCLHLVYVLQANSSTSNDCNVISFGVGALTQWSPGTASPSAYGNVGKSSSNFIFYLRGAGNTTINFTSYADQSGKIDVRLYSNKWVDVNTGTEHTYTTTQQTFFTTLASKNYIGVGTNQSNPLTGATVNLFALEEAQQGGN